MPNDNPPAPQPGIGGSIPGVPGPVRSGLIPKKITYPFAAPAFYADQIKQCKGYRSHGTQVHLAVHVRHKTIKLAGGDGVFNRFSKGY